MRTSTSRIRAPRWLLTVLALAAMAGVWAIAAGAVGKAIILPGPQATVQVLINLLGRADFWRHLGATMVRGLGGFILSYLAGTAVGMAIGLGDTFDTLFRPLLVTVRSTPVMALILLALIWFRSGMVAVFVTFLAVFPIVAQNIGDGIRNVDRQLVEMARVYRVSPVRTLTGLYVPAVLPYMAAAATAGLGLTWKVMISAEVLASPRWGIGTRMEEARVFLNTPEMFAWTVVVILIGFLFDQVLDAVVKKKLLFWK